MKKGNGLKIGAIAVMLLLLVGSVFASTTMAKQTKDGKITKAKGLAEKIEKDLETTGQYSMKDLDTIVVLLEDLSDVELSEKEKGSARRYIIEEIKKTIANKKFREKIGKTVKIKTLFPNVVERTKDYVIYGVSGPRYAGFYGGPSTFKQITKDITGGSGVDDHGNSFNINGDNDLIQVDVEAIPPLYNTFIYTLTYKDEDHPNPSLDATYDYFRRIWYGRIEDIESFTGYVWGELNFNGIWSNDETFAVWNGQHGYATFYGGPSTVYIATWNHAMDINDDNPSLSKTNMP